MHRALALAAIVLSGIPSRAEITYLDAAPANTTLADGSAHTPTAALVNNDNQWSNRALGNSATVYTANDSNANPGENAPMLRTTIAGLAPGGNYEVFVYFWGAGNDSPTGNQRWDIQAGLTEDAPAFFDTNGALNLGHASTGIDPLTHFTNRSPAVAVAESDRRLHQSTLGITTADPQGNIHIFIDDAPGNANRSWYDGVGWKPVEITDPEPPGPLREVAPDGAWTWFNDERAVFHEGQLFAGYVLRDGRYGVTRYHPASHAASHAVLSTAVSRQQNDHNNPSLSVLPDGRLLAIYSKHSSENRFYHRRSLGPLPATSADWGPEESHNTPSNNTYSNTFRLAGEDNLILHFTRSINWNPTVTASTDSAATWGSPRHFINAGSGSTRPYPKYSSNLHDRIDLILSDGHPRDVNNSIHHLFYREGFLRHSDGTPIRAFADLPLRFNEGERGTVVYPFSSAPWGPGQGPDDWIPGARAWTWSLQTTAEGNPACLFQVQLDNVTGTGWNHDRIYYYYARWTGTGWQRRFIAHGGRGLYQAEDDYGGGAAIDPENPQVIYISTNAANPFKLDDIQNIPLAAGERYEIWRGQTADGGLTFTWEPVTRDSTADNLRPFVPKGHGMRRHVLWFQGTYSSYTQFNTRVMGLFDPLPEPAGYDSWAASYGLDPASAMDDADSDGLANLLEYALGGDPLVPADRPSPAWRDGSFHFRHNPALPDLAWRIEWSDDLIQWFPAATAQPGETFVAMPGFQLSSSPENPETILSPIPAPNRIFLRLHTTRLP